MNDYAALFLLRFLLTLLGIVVMCLIICELNYKKKENITNKLQNNCQHEWQENTYFYHFTDIEHYFKCKKCGIIKNRLD